MVEPRDTTSIQKMPSAPPSIQVTPDPQLARPGRFLRGMVADLAASRHLVWLLLLRSLRGQYRPSLLGYSWILLPTLATTLIWITLNKAQIIQVAATDVPYTVYVLTNIVLWQGFLDALRSPMQQMSSSQAMLTKVRFPREAIFLVGLGEVLFTLVIRSGLILVVLLAFRFVPSPTLLLAPLAIAVLCLLGVTIGLLLVPLATLYKDVERSLTILTTLWFFATPVVYPPPTDWPQSLFIIHLNPVSPLLITARELLTTGELSYPGMFALYTALTLVVLVAAWIVLRLSLPHLIARIPG